MGCVRDELGDPIYVGHKGNLGRNLKVVREQDMNIRKKNIQDGMNSG